MGDLRVWDADMGGRLYTIMSGHRECRSFSDGRIFINLYAETIGGSMWGPTQASASIRQSPGECFEWVVRNDYSTDAVLRCKPALARAMTEDPAQDSWWGFTQCDTRPTAFLNITPGVVPETRTGMVVAHEFDHIRFIRRFPSCDDWKRALDANPQLRIDMEAQAHCVSARYEYEHGTYPSFLVAKAEMAAWLSWYFWNGDTRKATKEMDKWCAV